MLVCSLPLHGQEGDLLQYLQQYEGSWAGHFSIHSTANGYTESFPVEQRYWWEGEVLYGRAVSTRADGVETATSKTWVEGGKYIAEITRGAVKEAYFGVLHDRGVLWLSTNLARANDYQMRELFLPQEQQGRPRKMRIEGFDTYVYAKGLAHLIVKGELTLKPEEAK